MQLGEEEEEEAAAAALHTQDDDDDVMQEERSVDASVFWANVITVWDIQSKAKAIRVSATARKREGELVDGVGWGRVGG